ncbi:hypothetical protein HJW78_11400 [Klebsiella pneumoniae]|nr:hypothetical protein HJW78_11400 [Klebsiella pneumoniae]
MSTSTTAGRWSQPGANAITGLYRLITEHYSANAESVTLSTVWRFSFPVTQLINVLSGFKNDGGVLAER